MDTFLIRALQLIVSLSLLVIIHEGGHFLFARLFKVRVEKFCLFFDPWFTLFKFKPKKSETEYAVGWLPLGGYVKISGMIDESMDTEQMKQPMKPWEFRAKPAWQRLLIMTGGVLFNFLLALLIYSMVIFTWGDHYINVPEATYGMEFAPAAEELGFRDGDVLLSADGVPFLRSDKMSRQVLNAREVTVRRGEAIVSIPIPDDLIYRLEKSKAGFFSFSQPFVIDSLMANSPAMKAGLLPGDSIVALDGQAISSPGFTFAMNARAMEAKERPQDSLNLRRVELTYVRAGVTDTLSMSVDPDFKLGVYMRQFEQPQVDTYYGFFESFPVGIAFGVDKLVNYVSDLKYLFRDGGFKMLGGFGTIGSIFPPMWDWYSFWMMTALLSIILAFMNILPIPALDGGHVLFLIYEMVTRRKPSDKFMEYAQITGMVLLFGLLILANFNDVKRFFF
ncbi:MAG: RIP metalloprotease RseP [Mediterranea sp.]|jgi:regulator of sigma E protease|nr:RIP metalloprotease RseP [Mediterranea sp.]